MFCNLFSNSFVFRLFPGELYPLVSQLPWTDLRPWLHAEPTDHLEVPHDDEKHGALGSHIACPWSCNVARSHDRREHRRRRNSAALEVLRSRPKAAETAATAEGQLFRNARQGNAAITTVNCCVSGLPLNCWIWSAAKLLCWLRLAIVYALPIYVSFFVTCLTATASFH